MPVAALNVEYLEEILLGKCDSFITMGIWPAGEKLSPRKWLENFKPNEKEHALYLLNSFVYYNMDTAVALLKGAVLKLSERLPFHNSISAQVDEWNNFLNTSLFIPVTGESRNVTDSGNLIAGHLRRDLFIKQENILTVDNLYDPTYIGLFKSFRRVIFFDDFVGSGQQFLTMWQDDFEKDSKFMESVGTKCLSLNLEPYYCAMMGTEYGVNRIKAIAPEVKLSFSHILPTSASPLHPDSTTWPKHLKSTGSKFILEASENAGIPKSELMGFHNLGLSIAFSFTIPDATLPIFRWNKNGWSPLMEKS